MGQESASAPALNIRSVNYPYVRLEDAVELARKLWENFQKAAVDPATVGKAWNFSEKSSGLRSGIAALRQFGLLDSMGWGDTRKVKLSVRGLDIVTEPEGSPKRARAIKEAALAPKIYAEIFSNFPHGLPPSDHAISSFLLRDKDFNKNAVPSFVSNLRANLRFAQLANPSDIGEGTPDVTTKKDIAIGDLVQWESNGVLQFSQPTRVRAIKEHDGSKWVFVEGSETGLPVSEVSLHEKGDGKPGTAPTLPLEEAPAMKQSLSNTEKEWLRGQLSRETTYRLIVSGDMGPKEIAKLIKILTAQREVLEDEDDVA